MTNIDQAKALAREVMEEAKAALQRTGDVQPRVVMVKDGQVQQSLDVPGELVAGPPGIKDLVFGAAGQVARQLQADAVIWLTDSWVMMIDPERAKEMTEEEKGLGTRELERRGLGWRKEALTVSVETPMVRGLLSQEYSRTQQGIVFVGELREMMSDQESQEMKGRAFQAFSHSSSRTVN